jgi:hypothetical protein
MTKNIQNFLLLTLTIMIFQIPLSGQIVINEINYHSADNADSKDWLELHNTNAGQLDLSNWIVQDDNDANSFTFPAGTSITGNGYLVVVRNIDSFSMIYTDVLNYVGEFDFGLNNGGELIRLFDDLGTLVDTVNYDDEDPWPTDPDGLGATLQLNSPELDNAQAGNWSSGSPTPGAPNSTSSTRNPYTQIEMQISPNPFSASARLRINTNFIGGHGQILITNALGEVVKKISYNGESQIEVNGTLLSGGLYILRLVDHKNRISGVVKFVII